MTRVTRNIAVCLAACLLVLPALALRAQDNTAGAMGNQQRVQSLIQMRLMQALQLNPVQAQQLNNLVVQAQVQRRKLKQQVRSLTQQLGVISSSGNNAAIQETINQLNQAKSKLNQVDQEMFSESKKFLTPQQQAKFLLVMDEIRREVRSIRGFPGAAGGPGGTVPGQPYPYPANAYPGYTPTGPAPYPVQDGTWVK